MKHQYQVDVGRWYKDRNILVTGGAGFIGSHLVEHLVLFGAQVTVLDDLSKGNKDNLAAVLDRITFIHDTITDLNACNTAAKNQSVIFHCAARTSVVESETNQADYYHTNILGTYNLLQAAEHHKVDSFIFSSSAAVYGNQKGPCKETTPLKPDSFYGLTKLIGEVYTRYYHHHYHMNTINLRYFNVFGPRQHPESGVVALFEHKIASNESIIIYGDGSQTRDFVPVDRIVFANIMSAFHAHNLAGQTINVATGTSTSILEIVERLKSKYPHYTGNIQFSPAREHEIKHSWADCEKLTTELYG